MVENANRSDESALVRLAQAGDPRAFDTLARRFRPALRVIVAHMIPRDCVDDVVQDALLTAYKVLPSLGDETKFAGWLATIARRAAIRSLNSRREVTGVDRLILAYVPAIAEQISAIDQAETVTAAIARLPPDQRTAVELYYGADTPVSTIADLLGVPVTTVKWRLHSARCRLRDQLAFLQEHES